MTEIKFLGTAINTTMLGSYCRVAGDIPIDVLRDAIRMAVPRKIEENTKSALEGYSQTMTPKGDMS